MIHCLAIADVEEPIEYFVSLEKLNKPVNECIGVPEQDEGSNPSSSTKVKSSLKYQQMIIFI